MRRAATGSGRGPCAEESHRYGELPVLLARISPDVIMGMAGEELRKKTAPGDLFMVFGESDIESSPGMMGG